MHAPVPQQARRLDPGAVIRATFALYRAHARVLLFTALAVFATVAIIGVALLADSDSLLFVALAINVIATLVYNGLVVQLVAAVRSGRGGVGVRTLLGPLADVVGPLILVALLVGAAVLLGLSLLVLPGLYFLTIFSVAAPVVILERPGVFTSLGRSERLVRGNGWAVFAVIAVFFAILIVSSFVLELLGGSLGLVGALIGQVIANVLTAPLLALASSTLYFELRQLERA